MAFIFSLYRGNNNFLFVLLFRSLFGANCLMKIKRYIYILLACYTATFLRLFINNSLIVSFIGSLFFGFVIAKRLNYFKEKVILSGFFSCLTSFSGFIHFLYRILSQGDWIKFLIVLNSVILLNIFTMYFGFWISRKIT